MGGKGPLLTCSEKQEISDAPRPVASSRRRGHDDVLNARRDDPVLSCVSPFNPCSIVFTLASRVSVSFTGDLEVG